MRVRLLREMLRSLVPVPTSVRTFYTAVMRRKDDDHHASHNNVMNQYLHLVSSSVFVYCYAILIADLTTAMFLGLASLFVRQFGHAVLEPACHDEEALLLGYNTRNKTFIVLGYAVIPIVLIAQAGVWTFTGLRCARGHDRPLLVLVDGVRRDWPCPVSHREARSSNRDDLVRQAGD
jgi:glutamate-1-semialdehyde 2,1-aminomutase